MVVEREEKQQGIQQKRSEIFVVKTTKFQLIHQ
jgi:hypothetical protein